MTEHGGEAEVIAGVVGEPVRLVAFGRAGDLLAEVGRLRYLHAGPPIRAEETMAAMRGALIGALLLEGEAETAADADALIDAGGIELASCNDSKGAGALAGVVSPSVPVAVVEREDGIRTFGTVVEGLGRALSFGNYDQDTLDKVRWLSGEFSEVLNAAFARTRPVDIVDLQAKALRRGDECHNRLVAATESLIALLAPAFLEMGGAASAALAELAGNPHFFLSLSIAAAKAAAEAIAASGIRGVVTTMAGNGIHTGIKVSGAPKPWYLAPAPQPTDMMLVPGRSEEDAAPLMGDSAITETVGLGAFSMTASLSLARVLGVDAAGAQHIVSEMRQICVSEHPRFLLAADDFRGSPVGVSVGRVVDTGIVPAANAGYAHRKPGEGRVGANVIRFPLEPFTQAAADLG